MLLMYHYNFILFIDSSEDEAHDDLSNLVEERFSVFDDLRITCICNARVLLIQDEEGCQYLNIGINKQILLSMQV